MAGTRVCPFPSPRSLVVEEAATGTHVKTIGTQVYRIYRRERRGGRGRKNREVASSGVFQSIVRSSFLPFRKTDRYIREKKSSRDPLNSTANFFTGEISQFTFLM